MIYALVSYLPFCLFWVRSGSLGFSKAYGLQRGVIWNHWAGPETEQKERRAQPGIFRNTCRKITQTKIRLRESVRMRTLLPSDF